MDNETRARMEAWEQKHGKTLDQLNEEEWIEAIQEIMCLTEVEAREYLAYLERKDSRAPLM